MNMSSKLNDPEVKAALMILIDKGVQIHEIELWFGVVESVKKKAK